MADIGGPSSYTQYTAPSTGGQDVEGLANFGVKFIDQAYGAVSEDGTHRAEVVQVEASVVLGVSLSRTRLVLKWYVVAGGAEVAGTFDLSGQTVRIKVDGDK
jgi:hypothetical protein